MKNRRIEEMGKRETRNEGMSLKMESGLVHVSGGSLGWGRGVGGLWPCNGSNESCRRIKILYEFRIGICLRRDERKGK